MNQSIERNCIECYVERDMTIERIPLNPTLREIKKNFAEQQRDGLMNSEITFEEIRILDIRLADMDDEYWIFEVEFHYQPNRKPVTWTDPAGGTHIETDNDFDPAKKYE